MSESEGVVLDSLSNVTKHKDWYRTVTPLIRHPSGEDKVFLVFEGGSDLRFFKKIFITTNNEIHLSSPESGKEEVIDVVSNIRSKGYSNIYGICDSDFDRITLKIEEYDHNTFFFTDYHDLEITLLSLEIYKDILAECDDSSNVSPENIREDNKTELLNLLFPFSIVKYMNHVESLNLNFNKVNIKNFINIAEDGNRTIDVIGYINLLIEKSDSLDKEVFKPNVLIELYESYKEKEYDLLQLCNGHDFCDVFSKIYSKPFGSINNLNKDRVESSIRLASSLTKFSKTNLYRDIETILFKHGIEPNL